MKIVRLLSLAVIICLSSFVGAAAQDAFQGILPVTDPAMKKSLNGEWSLKVEEGITISEENEMVNDYCPVPPEDNTWGKIPVPGCWEAYGFCQPKYDSPNPLTGYYRTTFTVPEAWKGMRIVLRFDGVLYGYNLWVNGKKAGSWFSGYNTALFDITDFLVARQSKVRGTGWGEQQLAMRVISQFSCSDFDYNDDWAPNGIFRDVTLMAVPETHISDLTITTKNTGEVSVDTKIANAGKQTSVVHEILDAQGKIVGSNMVEHPHLWSAETPYLYTLRTRLIQKNKTLQTFEHKFGFHELTIDGNILKLNGQPIKLRGVTSHATDPKTVKVIDEELTLKDMRLMKEASVNYIRTSHYPREPRFYELADSLGFYIIDEVPFGYGDKNLSREESYPVLQRRAQGTIRRDKNHPSVLIWSLGNENPLTDICQKLGEYVKNELDPSRPICYPQVGSYFRKFNYDFPKVADIYAPHYPTTSQIAGFYQNADRPVIFTEYCHTLGVSLEDHDRQWEIIERTPCIAGGSVWEWTDQGMPFRQHLNDRYGYEEKVYTSTEGGFEMYGNKGTDGLLYADRTPLPNYYELQHNYAQAFVADSILMTDDECLRMQVVNRFDFLNLKDHVTFRWAFTEDRDTIAQGAFSPFCKPHQTAEYELSLPQHPNPNRISLLHIEVFDAQGRTFLHQAIPVNPSDLTARLLVNLPQVNADPMAVMQSGILVRAGRKATLAEQIRVKDKRLERYLLQPSTDGKSAGNIATQIHTETTETITHLSFTLTPDTTDTFLSELGIAFLLDSNIDRVQWIGNGLMPTYPGRFRAGQYGFWALHKDDLYFEGNRMGVDAALLTDSEGNGLLILCHQGNISFEQTDRGIVVSYNAAVSGQGPKFSRTAFPVIANQIGSVSGDFYLYPISSDSIPETLRNLFDDPRTVPVPFHPFETQYDTYLMRYDDIISRQ